MKKIKEKFGTKADSEIVGSGEEISFGRDELKVVTYKDALNIALKVLEELDD